MEKCGRLYIVILSRTCSTNVTAPVNQGLGLTELHWNWWQLGKKTVDCNYNAEYFLNSRCPGRCIRWKSVLNCQKVSLTYVIVIMDTSSYSIIVIVIVSVFLWYRVYSPESRVKSPESRVKSSESSPGFRLCRKIATIKKKKKKTI